MNESTCPVCNAPPGKLCIFECTDPSCCTNSTWYGHERVDKDGAPTGECHPERNQVAPQRKVLDVIAGRISDLQRRKLASLVQPMLRLSEAIGDIEIDAQSAHILEWILNWDHDVILGIAHLIVRSKAQQRFDILSRAVATSSYVSNP